MIITYEHALKLFKEKENAEQKHYYNGIRISSTTHEKISSCHPLQNIYPILMKDIYYQKDYYRKFKEEYYFHTFFINNKPIRQILKK
jgi:hypothetical protein